MDVVRLTLALLAKRHLDKADEVEASGPEGFEFGSKPSPYALFEDMPAHREQHDKGWITAIQSTFKELMKHLPEDARVSPGEATNIACRANSESHLFLDTFDRGYNEVIGVFPLSSMYFNHSCDPNCVYVGLPDGRLEIRTLYDVPKGAELSVSYVDLLQPREQRRRQLLLTRHFWCKCRRCSMPLSKSEDRFMDGILCRKCRRGVMIFEETKEVSDIDELMRDIEALNNEIQGKSAMCESCATEMPVTELVDVLKGAIEAYGSAFIALRERRNADAKAGFDEFLKKYDQKQVLHPYNSYLINAYIGLMQLGQMMDEPALSLTSGRQVVDRMSKSGALSPNSPELARYQAMLGRLYISVAKKKEEIPRQTPATKGLIRRYRIDGKGWIELAYNARYVALGQSHPLTVQLQQLSQTLLPRPPQAATPGPVAEAANSSGSNSADAAVAESSLEAAKKAKAKENKKPTIAQLQQTVKAAAAAAAAANGNNEEKQQE
ncbi:hypothetical protein EV182_002985 [Spiromyces aspiralis]|uniref:Uncharacterized protein n=1 Tax=Spiromyces aspiralis TaxID=68401 RepID=A0ACC1HG14_9FUNG|nr:hypothetical protein EV182_002985 [Spiromyces aspiralis]